MTKSTHGGPGRGQGRKRQFERLERRTVTLQPADVEYLEALGNGKLSVGIRKAVQEMNIRKPNMTHVEFKSLDWQNAVATMEPKEAVSLLAKEIEALVEQSCASQTPQHKSRQAELVHNGFISRAYPHLTGTRNSLFYRDVAHEMYSFKPLHDKVDYDH